MLKSASESLKDSGRKAPVRTIVRSLTDCSLVLAERKEAVWVIVSVPWVMIILSMSQLLIMSQICLLCTVTSYRLDSLRLTCVGPSCPDCPRHRPPLSWRRDVDCQDHTLPLYLYSKAGLGFTLEITFLTAEGPNSNPYPLKIFTVLQCPYTFLPTW